MPSKRAESKADELYALPLGEFTQARDQLARDLRTEGKRDEADAVKALRKPTAAAWALNQLARRRRKDVERLLSAGKRLRKAHEGLLRGGDRSALQKATAQERDLVDELARDARAIAGEAGTASSSATFDEHIRNTLHAAALDDDTAAELASGRLLRERGPIGMFGAGTASPAPPAKPGKARASGKAADEQAKVTRTQRRERERALAAARAGEQQAKREHARAAKATERAAKAAAEAHRRAEAADAALREAEAAEHEAATARDRAARAVASAEEDLA